jgi:hypothetical protein
MEYMYTTIAFTVSPFFERKLPSLSIAVQFAENLKFTAVVNHFVIS